MRSALYLAGNKTKLVEDIIPHLTQRGKLVDVFTGSGVIALAAKRAGITDIVANDLHPQMISLHKWLQGTEEVLPKLNLLRKEYEHTKEDYLRLREDFNKDQSDMERLYLLMCRGFSNMIRFTGRGGNHDVPWGDRNPFFPRRITRHQKLCKDIDFRNQDFGDLIESIVDSGVDLSGYTFYLDCPYYGTTAVYQDGGGWSANDNFSMMDWSKFLAENGAKVVISNIFENKGFVHQDLIDWCEDNEDLFEVYHLNRDYSNCSFRKGTGKTDEVLICSKN